MAVGNPTDAIFPPTVGARVRLLEREKLPRCASGAVVFAHRPPLALGKIRAPAFPVLLLEAGFFQAAVFRGQESGHGGESLDGNPAYMVASLAEGRVGRLPGV